MGGDGAVDDIFQCCYTNSESSSGGIVSSGWKAVAVSNDIPSEAYRFCMEMQNRNSVIRRKPCDESGKTLNLLQIFGGKGYFYVMRSQYGLVDRVGRPNMFSQAFIIPQRQGLADPNSFLGISDSSFKYTEAEAGKFEEPIRTVTFTFGSALDKSGLALPGVKMLVKAIYVQFLKNLAEPLFVQYDGNEERLKAIIFLIYTCVPLFIRRKLKIASCTSPADSMQNIIFSINASRYGRYVDPFTQESSVLGNKEDLHLKKIAFIDYPFDKIGWTNQDFYSYYCDIEKNSKEFGDAAGSSELALKVSFQYYLAKKNGFISLSGKTEEEIKDCLDDVERLQSHVSPLYAEWKNKLSEELKLRRRSISKPAEFPFPDIEKRFAVRTITPSMPSYKIRTTTIQSQDINTDKILRRNPSSDEKNNFWSGISLLDIEFSPTEIKKYKDYDDGSKKSQIFGLFVKLYEAKTFEDFFNNFLFLYRKYGKNVDYDVLSSSLEKLIEANTILFDNKTKAYRKLIVNLFLQKHIPESDFKKFVGIVYLLEDRSFKDFICEYEKLGKNSNFKEFSKALFEIAKPLDSVDNPVPLDVWLSISSNVWDNSFEFLDKIDPRLCEMEVTSENVSVVEKSNLRKYTRDATRYIKNKGPHSALVKDWMPLFTGRSTRKPIFPMIVVLLGCVVIVGIILFFGFRGKRKNKNVETVNPILYPEIKSSIEESNAVEEKENDFTEGSEIPNSADADDQFEIESDWVEEKDEFQNELENKATKADNLSFGETMETFGENAYDQRKETKVMNPNADNQAASDSKNSEKNQNNEATGEVF